jgi:transposase
MAKPLISDELWELIQPLLPPEPPKPKGGRPRISHRQALTGILFVLKTAIPWEALPQEMGSGSGMPCWPSLRDFQPAGIWEQIHQPGLQRLQGAERIDWRRGVLDSASVRGG